MMEGRAKSEPAVVARDLERRFGRFVAVDRVSFEVARGEIFGFLGPNGAGKSTTIRMLCGILAPTGGGGTVAGFDIAAQGELVKASIGYMSQKFSLYEDLTVEENIDFYSGIYRIAPHRKGPRKDWVLEMAGGGVTVFVTTHYMDEAEYCDRVALIYRGELIAVGSPDDLKRDLMKEAVLEIQCDRPHEAMEAVEKAAGVKEAAMFGKDLHAVAGDLDAALRDIPARLAAGGFAVAGVRRIAPSLEDVFVSLIEARDRAAAPQREVRR